MSLEQFREQLARRANNAQLEIETGLIDPLELYLRLLARWNQKVNLTALPLDPLGDETIDRLIIEPLVAAQFVQDSWSPWFDIGSGGGSPAIPIKLANPTLSLTMVESRGRKAAFLRQLVHELSLQMANVEAVRFEELAARPEFLGSAGLITLRGVRSDDRLVESAAAVLRSGGHMLAFRHNAEAEPRNSFTLTGTHELLRSESRRTFLVHCTKP